MFFKWKKNYKYVENVKGNHRGISGPKCVWKQIYISTADRTA